MVATLIAIASLPVVVVRPLGAGLPMDVRVRLVALFGLVALLAALPLMGMGHQVLGLESVVLALVVVFAAGLTWRIPTRLRTWGTEVGEGVLVLLSLTLLLLPESRRGAGFLVVCGLALLWMLLGVVEGLRGRDFERRPIASVAMGAGVVLAVVLATLPSLQVFGPSFQIAAVVVAWLVVVGLVPETRPTGRELLVELSWALLGAGVLMVALVLVGMPLDERMALPGLVGAILVGVRYFAATPQLPADPVVMPSSSNSLHLQRETLVVLERLADPGAAQIDGMPESLEHVFPGARMELLHRAGALHDAGSAGPTVDDQLLAVVCRRGVLRSEASEELPGRVKGALRRLGRDAVVLPVVCDATVHGALVVRGLRPSESTLTQLRRFADLLGHRLETRRLYDALQHKQRLADLGTFAAALAHDLRGPLAAVRLEAQLMSCSATDSQREAADNIVEAIDRVLHDLSGTLDFTRPMSLELGRLPLATLLDEIIEAHQEQARAQDVQLNVIHEHPEVEIRGDRARLRRAFENLVRNALEVTPSGAAIEVRTAVGHAGLEVTVADQGPGIEPAVAERIFEPFVTSKPEGIGLGLAVVRKVVEAHHGRVSAQAHPGGGTCMHVLLPLPKRATPPGS